ncbi:MAG TPA: biotin/lipoyl-binding protein, partial [Thermoanaerobaculia bacterium]|nr:biotin/lipoyl-binding protein [Thermoanaerobaculia bacterium]
MDEPLKKTPHAPEPTPERALHRRPRRFIPWIIAAAVVTAGAWYGVRTVSFYRHHAETDDAQIEGHIDPVLPRVSGYVTEVKVDDNQRVRAGDVLLRIDTRDLEAKIQTAAGAVENARAQVAVARANVAAADTARGRTAGDLERYAALRRKE